MRLATQAADVFLASSKSHDPETRHMQCCLLHVNFLVVKHNILQLHGNPRVQCLTMASAVRFCVPLCQNNNHDPIMQKWSSLQLHKHTLPKQQLLTWD